MFRNKIQILHDFFQIIDAKLLCVSSGKLY
jgi:hypothetical protein